MNKFPLFYPNAEFRPDPDRGDLFDLPDNKPEGIVVHYSCSYNLNDTDRYFDRESVDIHFLLGSKGEIIQKCELNRWCTHAGASYWNGRTNLNRCFLGIEVVNIGELVKIKDKYYDCYRKEYTGKVNQGFDGHPYASFTPEQEKTLEVLCNWLVKNIGIEIHNICGHYECSPGRKVDPIGNLSYGNMVDFRKRLYKLT